MILGTTTEIQVLVATKPVDFRKQSDGLAAIVQQVHAAEPFSGAIYVFRSKRSDRVKLLWWETRLNAIERTHPGGRKLHWREAETRALSERDRIKALLKRLNGKTDEPETQRQFILVLDERARKLMERAGIDLYYGESELESYLRANHGDEELFGDQLLTVIEIWAAPRIKKREEEIAKRECEIRDDPLITRLEFIDGKRVDGTKEDWFNEKEVLEVLLRYFPRNGAMFTHVVNEFRRHLANHDGRLAGRDFLAEFKRHLVFYCEIETSQ